MYLQNYNPLGVGLLSILVAAVPILTLLYFVALHPHRDAAGQRHLGISAPWAAFAGVVASFIVALVVMGMPPLAVGQVLLVRVAACDERWFSCSRSFSCACPAAC